MPMGRLTVNMFITLDGVIQAPGAPEEDGEGGFRFGGWQAPVSDEKTGADITKGLLNSDGLLLGRKTYDIFAGYWPNASGPIADKFNGVAKYVASRSLTKPSWQGTTVLEGDLAKAVARIKRKHKDIHTWGSSQILPTLLQHGLVDVLDLYLYPVVLGTGKRLFPEGVVPMAFKLTHSATYKKGAVHLRYEPNGKPEFASMA
ncbi:MAG: dihydrofolate reductase family protein [Thermoplasmatota archaeon]